MSIMNYFSFIINITLRWNSFVIRKNDPNKIQYFLFVCLIQGLGTLTVLHAHIGSSCSNPPSHTHVQFAKHYHTTVKAKKKKALRDMCIATFGRPEKKCYHQLLFFFLLQEEARSQRTSNYGRTPKGSFSAKCSDTYQAQFLNRGLKIHCSNNFNHSLKYFSLKSSIARERSKGGYKLYMFTKVGLLIKGKIELVYRFIIDLHQSHLFLINEFSPQFSTGSSRICLIM